VLLEQSSFALSACPITTIAVYYKPLTMNADFDIGHWGLGVFRSCATISATCASLRERISRTSSAPHDVTFVKELSKTATGKIQKYVLRKQRAAITPQ
jgi:hypothetical protein